MNLSDIIKKRRSIRQYAPQPVEREKIEQCLEAARLAPSACNTQPWKFLVIDDEAVKEKFAAEAFSGIYSKTMFVAKAPAIVAIVSDPDWLPRAGGTIRKLDFHLIDVGIAAEHFVLKATELGLGTCWIGWFDGTKAKKALGITGSKKIEILLSLGYPAEDATVRPLKRKSLEEISMYNSWSKD